MDASCVDPPVAMVAAGPSLITAALVRTLTAAGFDVHLPTDLVPVEAHPHDRRHLHPVPTARHARESDGTALLGAVRRTGRPLALAVLDQDQADAGSLGIGARALMNGWAGGHLLVVREGSAPATATAGGPSVPSPATPWHAVGRLVRRRARRPGAPGTPHISLTVVHHAPPPPADQEAAVRWSAALPLAHSPLQARRAAEAGVAIARRVSDHGPGRTQPWTARPGWKLRLDTS